MNYIIFDLEWNQCPDGKHHENPQLPFEVLEIGAIKLDSSKKETGRFHEFIQPTVYRRLHYKTQEIIHMSQEQLDTADPFPYVIERFRMWCGEDALFCTWGSLDLLELQRNIRFHKVANFFPFPLKFYDIQKIFSRTYEDGKSRRTLEYAVDMLSIEKDIPFHEALSDAYYTALILKRLTDEQLLPFFSYDYFRNPRKRKDEIYTVFDNYSKFISKTFPTKTDVMRDRRVVSTKCYLCGKPAKKKIRWFLNGSRNYSCLACCEEHGYLKGKIRLKKAEDQKGFFCVKTLKLIDDKRALEICERQEKLRERKRLKRHIAKELS